MDQEIKLGLGNPPEPQYLFVGAGKEGNVNYEWYYVDFDNGNQTVPETRRALTGYIRELRINETEYKGEKKPKLDIFISADQPYVVRSGLDTVFTRGVILALAIVEDYTEPLIIAVAPSDQEKVVFGKVYRASGEKISVEWQKDANLMPLINHIQELLGQEPSEAPPATTEQPAQATSRPGTETPATQPAAQSTPPQGNTGRVPMSSQKRNMLLALARGAGQDDAGLAATITGFFPGQTLDGENGIINEEADVIMGYFRDMMGAKKG